MNINLLFIVFLVIGTLSSCTTTGYFTSNPKSRMAFAGSTFVLTKSDSFELTSWTDVHDVAHDNEGNRIWNKNMYLGKGTYEKSGDSLELHFSSSDSIHLELFRSSGEIKDTYEIRIVNEVGNPLGLLVSLADSNHVELKRFFSARNGAFTTFSLLKDDIPAFIKIHEVSLILAIENTQVPIKNLKNGLNRYGFKTYRGYFPKGLKKTIWFRPTPTGIRFKLDKRKRYLPKKWRIPLLNRLYRDY